MIDIGKKCCGCNSCAQSCPKQCISMSEDNEGFLYPSVDTNGKVGKNTVFLSSLPKPRLMAKKILFLSPMCLMNANI